MLKTFFATDRSSSLLVQRLVLAIVILPHGMQKLFGSFGGFGFDATMGYFASLGIPAALGALVIVAEVFGSLALVIGLGTRLAALGIMSTLIGAVAFVHVPNGFFMNWSGTAAGEGFEYHLLALALALPLVLKGAGSYSVDRALARGLDGARSRAMASVSQ